MENEKHLFDFNGKYTMEHSNLGQRHVFIFHLWTLDTGRN